MKKHNKLIQIPLDLWDRISVAKGLGSANLYIVKALEKAVPTLEELRQLKPEAPLFRSADKAPIAEGAPIPPRPVFGPWAPPHWLRRQYDWDMQYGTDEQKAAAVAWLPELEAKEKAWNERRAALEAKSQEQKREEQLRQEALAAVESSGAAAPVGGDAEFWD